MKFDAVELRRLAAEMLAKAGLAAAPRDVTAKILVDADLLGYVTHGIQFLPQYCKALEAGSMTRDGTPELVHDTGATLVFDGGMLPGPYCVVTAVDVLLKRARQHGVVTAVIRRSANTACLATYLLPIVEAGCLGTVMVSSPDGRAVAPAGGSEARLSTNPLAFGFPTGGDAVLIDMATSATTNRMTEKLQRAGQQHSGEPMLDREGRPTNDPFVLATGGGGAIRPFGGERNEHKGFALALAVQAMSAALSAGGGPHLADAKGGPGSCAFVQVIDPGAFGGSDIFRREMDHLVATLMDTPPRPGSTGVRIPGQRAMSAYRQHAANGVEISDELAAHVRPVADRYGLAFPTPLANG